VRRTSVHALHFSANLNHPRASPERITLLTGASTHSRYSSISSNALIFASRKSRLINLGVVSFIFAQQATLWSAYPSFLPRYNYINGTPASSSNSAQKLEPDIVILKPSLLNTLLTPICTESLPRHPSQWQMPHICTCTCCCPSRRPPYISSLGWAQWHLEEEKDFQSD
jgi:hypothetical protein